MLPKQTVLYLISPIMSDWCSLTSLWVRSTQKASNQTQISCGVVSQYTQGLVTFNDIPAILFLYITTPKSPAHRTQTPCGAFSSYISFKLNTLPSYPLHMLVPHHLDHMRFSDGHSGTPQKSADRRNKPPFVHSLFSWLLNVLNQCLGVFFPKVSRPRFDCLFSVPCCTLQQSPILPGPNNAFNTQRQSNLVLHQCVQSNLLWLLYKLVLPDYW